MDKLHVDIDMEQLRSNINVVLAHVPEEIAVIGVVKSGGYGHGAPAIGRVLRDSGIKILAVSDLEEALDLRKKCQDTPILILGEIEKKHMPEAVSNGFTVTLSTVEAAEQLSRIAQAMDACVRVHVKVDTGMGRFGMAPENVVKSLKIIGQLPCLDIEGMFSHLSMTFSIDEESNAFTLGQMEIFETVCQEAASQDLLPNLVHIGSSTALLGFPDRVMSKPYTGIRIGTLFFGYEERPSSWRRKVRPVAEIHTNIQMIRELPPNHGVGYSKTFTTSGDTRLAILPIGYGHGFHRDFGNVGEVIVRDRRAPILGKPSLGQILVDVTHIPEAAIGDRVVLAGPDLSAFTQAQNIGRGTWEVLLPLLEHSERIYF